MEWKFKVGDVVGDKYNVYTVTRQYFIRNGYSISFKGESYFVTKELVESDCELVEPKPKSLFEQALMLVGLEIEQLFTFDFINNYSRGTNIYKFEKDGSLWHMVNPSLWESYNRTLSDILTSGKLPKIYKPKSEAELILDELEKVVDKAKGILERSGR
jgi:hypothetical protein